MTDLSTDRFFQDIMVAKNCMWRIDAPEAIDVTALGETAKRYLVIGEIKLFVYGEADTWLFRGESVQEVTTQALRVILK